MHVLSSDIITLMPERDGKIEVECLPLHSRFSAENSEHTDFAAKLLIENGVGIIAFNGIYGLFTNVDNKPANDRILQIKNRPNDKNLVLVSAPEHLNEHVDFEQTYYSHEQVAQLQQYLHALGVILPAGNGAPSHITSRRNEQSTVLSIWTEYESLRRLITKFRQMGGRAFAGTSANKDNQPTHIDAEEAWQDLGDEVDFIVKADFSHLPNIRKQSTSIIDLTQSHPSLHRLGNVTREEIQEALLKFGFPDLQVDREKIIFVSPRK